MYKNIYVVYFFKAYFPGKALYITVARLPGQILCVSLKVYFLKVYFSSMYFCKTYFLNVYFSGIAFCLAGARFRGLQSGAEPSPEHPTWPQLTNLYHDNISDV